MKAAVPQQDRALDLICLGRVGVDLYAQQPGARLEDATSFAKYLSASAANIVFGAARLTMLRAHAGRICHVHCKDVRKPVVELARNRQWSFPDCISNGAFTAPGAGDLDFAPIVRELIAGAYDGWLVVEAEQDPAVAPSELYARKGFQTPIGLLSPD